MVFGFLLSGTFSIENQLGARKALEWVIEATEFKFEIRSELRFTSEAVGGCLEAKDPYK